MDFTNDVTTELKYFAAANGYGGFRSYFGEVFNSADYSKIYVLKGGPGTGKSSLLKRLANLGFSKGLKTEAIYCSSDPFSLDGVILQTDCGNVAVLDGTAPHERDAVIPGAVDEIINLGENWNSELLRKDKKEILDINAKKKEAYRKAYEYLNLCIPFSEKIKSCAREKINSNLTYKILKNINVPVGHGRKKARLISAFGKNGYVKLDTLKKTASNLYTVSGISGADYAFMQQLLERSIELESNCTVFPSPFDKDLTEAIYFDDTDTTVLVDMEGGEHIDAVKTLNSHNFCIYSQEELLDFSRTIDLLKEKSRLCFERASELHFELEKIYISTMNFSENDAIYERLSRELL